MSDPVVLLGRASYGARRTAELERLAMRLGRQRGSWTGWAVIDGDGPRLRSALDLATTTAPVGRVVVVPVTLPSDLQLERWLTQLVRRWLAERDGRWQVVLAPPLAEAGALVDAVAEHVERHALAAPLTANGASPNDPEWSVLPAHRHHLLLCRGPRCTAAGAGDVAAAIADALDRHRLGDEHVLVTSCGCLHPCNLGPTAVVYPERIWYGGMTADSGRRLVEQHLLGGELLADHCVQPGPQRQRRPGGAWPG